MLAEVERVLNRRFLGMEEQIRGLVLAVASGEPMLLIGPPGCAKSRLIRAFCGVIGLINEDNPEETRHEYFEYLLTPFTEPGELFGFYNLAELAKGEKGKGLIRNDEGMLQHAQVVFLDEVFNASSAILNSLLAILNEGIFHDRGQRIRVEARNFFAATNYPPEAAALRAFYDRFLLRCNVDNLKESKSKNFPADLQKLLSAGWRETYSDHPVKPGYGSLLDGLAELRHEIRSKTNSGALTPLGDESFFDNLAQLVSHARQYDLSEMSNRRLVKMSHVMLIHRLYRSVDEEHPERLAFAEPELDLLRRFSLDHEGDLSALRQMERKVKPMR